MVTTWNSVENPLDLRKNINFDGLAALLVLGVGQVWAYPITSGDTVSLQTSYVGVNGAFKVFGSGGQVYYSPENPFLTFCVERDVYFTPSTTTYKATISDSVMSGTENAQTVRRGLDNGTKYLYWNFVNGTLTNYKNDAADAAALQYAIWSLQGYALKAYEHNAAQKYLSQVPSNNYNVADYNVKVMNLWTASGAAAQSQLIAQVPEPGTLLLLGSGLAGLALYRRRTRR